MSKKDMRLPPGLPGVRNPFLASFILQPARNSNCNLANKSYNVSHLGKPSDVITSVTVPTDRSLFGSVVSYIDVESRTSIVKGTCSELVFHMTDQDGKSIDIGEVLIEMYLE
jgi:hypothetical protein